MTYIVLIIIPSLSSSLCVARNDHNIMLPDATVVPPLCCNASPHHHHHHRLHHYDENQDGDCHHHLLQSAALKYDSQAIWRVQVAHTNIFWIWIIFTIISIESDWITFQTLFEYDFSQYLEYMVSRVLLPRLQCLKVILWPYSEYNVDIYVDLLNKHLD